VAVWLASFQLPPLVGTFCWLAGWLALARLAFGGLVDLAGDWDLEWEWQWEWDYYDCDCDWAWV